MDYFILPLVACGASLLSFFSGFGLGTLLMPVFALFFSVELAVALAAVVHFLNGLFKLVLVGRYASKTVILRFGLPAIAAAFAGAWLLDTVAGLPPLTTYRIAGHSFQILPVKVILALLIAGFSLFEVLPRLKNMKIDGRYLSVGGLVSGFFGGLSGHQGALRSAFLARSGLSGKQFVATGVVIASMIDAVRIGVYSGSLFSSGISGNLGLLAVTVLAAFAGACFGSNLLKKITMHGIQRIVSVCLLLLALALGFGWV